MSSIVPVILSGGMGTRLWPLSREDRPKQFSQLVGEQSLLQQTVQRLAELDTTDPVVVCNREHGDAVNQQLEQMAITPLAILLEPEGRNTAPAVAAAAQYISQHGDGEAKILLVLPADHIIKQAQPFAAAISSAVDAAGAGNLVTLGIVPDRPETGYGYLKRGAQQQNFFHVEQFVEKPNLEAAQAYLASGQYLWNSGIFAFTMDAYLAELDRLQPEMARQVAQAVAGGVIRGCFFELEAGAFYDCPSNSIDYAIMEKTSKAVGVPLDAGWSDVGSWSAVAELAEADTAGNTARGNVLLYDCSNSHFQSSGRLIAGVGVRDHIVVETPDAVLIVHRDQAQNVKALVDMLRDSDRSELRGLQADNDGEDSGS